MKLIVNLIFLIVSSITAYGQQECLRTDQINTVISFLNRNQIKDFYFWQSCFGANANKTKLHINSYKAESCGNNMFALKIVGTINGNTVSGRVNVNDLYILYERYAISLGTLEGIQTSPCVAQIDLGGGQNQDNVQSSTNTINRNSAPVLSLSTSTINFGAVSTGSLGSQNFIIKNAGNATLIITGVKWNNNAFRCSSISSTIVAGGSIQVTLYFQPKTAGQFSDVFTISSNGGSNTITFSGQGIQANTQNRVVEQQPISSNNSYSYPFGYNMGQFNGIPTYYNKNVDGTEGYNIINNYNTGFKWQCV